MQDKSSCGHTVTKNVINKVWKSESTAETNQNAVPDKGDEKQFIIFKNK